MNAQRGRDTVTSLAPIPPQFTRHRSGATLTVLSGPDQGASVRVGVEPVVVGTARSADLLLTDTTVSKKHLRASTDGQVVRMVDLGSKNGSFFEGKAFAERELRVGDQLCVGKTVLKILPAEDEVSPDPIASEMFGALVARSHAMRQLFTLIEQVAPHDIAVLIEGETGCGKELVAEEIHRRSRRRDAPFIVFDCGAVPDDLIESTLFGHRKGAFTGATTDQPGIFADADGGTVFLDEIGELKPSLQPTLLRVLDRGMIRPVGATSHRKVDVRIVAATHRNLASMIDNGTFRDDLYYRLSAYRLSIRPLRDRHEDIPVLVKHMLRKRGRPDLRVRDEDMQRLSNHAWPGNVRELQNVIDRGIVRAKDGEMCIDDLSESGPARGDTPTWASRSFREAKAEVVEAFERAFLEELMQSHDKLSSAAEAAQMDRRHLRTLLRRHGLRDD